MEDKSLKTIQQEVDEWVNQFKKPYFEPLSNLASLMEELGEISRVLNRMYGDKPAKNEAEARQDLEEEIGDLMFSLICMANAEGIDLTTAHARKMAKVQIRDNDRFEK